MTLPIRGVSIIGWLLCVAAILNVLRYKTLTSGARSEQRTRAMGLPAVLVSRWRPRFRLVRGQAGAAAMVLTAG